MPQVELAINQLDIHSLQLAQVTTNHMTHLATRTAVMSTSRERKHNVTLHTRGRVGVRPPDWCYFTQLSDWQVDIGTERRTNVWWRRRRKW